MGGGSARRGRVSPPSRRAQRAGVESAQGVAPAEGAEPAQVEVLALGAPVFGYCVGAGGWFVAGSIFGIFGTARVPLAVW